MSRKSNKNQQGFTIAELLIATAVFSVLLVGILSALIKVSDLFYKGVSMSKTQEDARNIVQSISDDIQFSARAHNNFNADSHNNPVGVFCIGNHRYRYQIGTQVDNGPTYGLARDSVGGGACSPVGTMPLNTATTRYMLDASMQLNALSVTCNSGRCNVKIHLIFYGGDPDGLFISPSGFSGSPWQAPDAQCTGGIETTDLCATVDYDSTVLENTQ